MTLKYTLGSFDVLMMTKEIILPAMQELERQEKREKKKVKRPVSERCQQVKRKVTFIPLQGISCKGIKGRRYISHSRQTH